MSDDTMLVPGLIVHLAGRGEPKPSIHLCPATEMLWVKGRALLDIQPANLGHAIEWMRHACEVLTACLIGSENVDPTEEHMLVGLLTVEEVAWCLAQVVSAGGAGDLLRDIAESN